MFPTTLKPVTLFTSQDEGAPKLTPSAGSLKAVLAACLTKGYGNKTALGWNMAFEDANNAAFHSQSPESNRHFIRIQNPQPRHVLVQGFRAMSSLTAGSGEFGYPTNNQKFGCVENGVKEQPWWLIGHDCAFLLLVGAANGNDAAALYFGDVPSLVPQDTGNTLILHNSSVNYDYFSTSGFSFISSGGNRGYFAKRWDNTEAGVEAELHSLLAHSQLETAFPDKISGGLSASEIYVCERNNGLNFRGILSGIYRTAHNLQDLPNGTPVRLDGVTDTMLKFRLNYSGGNYYLVNVSNWKA